MRCLGKWIALMAIMALASQRLPAQNPARIATGTVKSASAGRIEITLSANYGPGLTQGAVLAVAVPSGMPVKPQTDYVSNQPLTIADLAPGDQVMLRFSGPAGAYTATAITLNSTAGRKRDGDFRTNVPSRVAPATAPGTVAADSSALTLDQTYAFLETALVSGGKRHVDMGGAGSWHATTDVHAKGCVLQWVEKWYMPNPTQNTMQEYDYTLNLSKLNVGNIQVDRSSGMLQLTGTVNGSIRSYYKQFQGSRLVNQHDDARAGRGFARLYLTHQDNLDQRVGEALKHAGRLCGAQ